jgi:hypothetical protein
LESNAKWCPSCENWLTLFDFNKSANRSDGRHWCCKECHRAKSKTQAARNSQKNRDSKRYAKAPEKVKARTKARDYWGSAKKYKCAILNCTETADHLHHISYTSPLDVVPYCKYHHFVEHER